MLAIGKCNLKMTYWEDDDWVTETTFESRYEELNDRTQVTVSKEEIPRPRTKSLKDKWRKFKSS